MGEVLFCGLDVVLGLGGKEGVVGALLRHECSMGAFLYEFTIFQHDNF